MIINAGLKCKEFRVDTQSCIVEKVIELSDEGFHLFKNNLLDDYPFIESHKHLMGFDENGKAHCLLVIGEDSDDGILIESEGYNYARYSSFISNARQIIEQDSISPVLKDFVNTLQEKMDKLVDDLLSKCEYDHFTLSFDEIQSKLGEYKIDRTLIKELLCDRDEINHIESDSEYMSIFPKGEYLEGTSENNPDEIFIDESSGELAEIMCAKHVLWIFDNGNGEQLNFTNHRVDNIDFIGKNMCSAKLSNGKFNNCSFKDASLCFTYAEKAVFKNCDFSFATAEESEFINCRFINCNFKSGIFTHSDFTGSKFKNCKFEKTVFHHSLISGMEILDENGEKESTIIPELYGSTSNSELWQSESNEGVIQS